MTIKLFLRKVLIKSVKKIYYCYRKLFGRLKPLVISEVLFHNFKPSCRFLFNPNNKDYYIEKLNSLNVCQSIISSADKICSHQFNILGSGNIYLGEKLTWNEDFKTGFIWENKFYKDIKIVDLNNNADVKMPWELSRFQHLFTLGKAYWITGNEKYAVEFKEEMESWTAENPVEASVNWACTMDVSIRAVNLICAYYFFTGSASINTNFWSKFNNLLYTHGKFIYKNLENEQECRSNHYLSDLAGLIWLGIYFVECYQAAPDICHEKWLRFGLLEFENEMKKQINEDGTDYEGSTSYHRLVTEIFLNTTILCNKNGIYFSKAYMTKLEKMCEFIMDITKPNGLSPVIGDADDGRFLIFSNYAQWNKRDFRHILAAAGEYFNRDNFRCYGKSCSEDALWCTGEYKQMDINTETASKAYDKGGCYILRNSRFYCMVRCGEMSLRGQGGHSHNHQLSIELNVEGEDFIIDPGTYVYTSDYKMRNLFRSTKMHNTLCIDKYEQNDFNDYKLFEMKEQSFAQCTLFNDTCFCGRHYGYKEKCGAVHERKIEIQNNQLIITDRLSGYTGNEDVYINFILDCDVQAEEADGGIKLYKNQKEIFMKFKGQYKLEKTFVSYGYGEKLITKRILIKPENYLEANITIM